MPILKGVESMAVAEVALILICLVILEDCK